MSPTSETDLSLRQAALWAGSGLLAMMIAAPFAEFAVYGRLVVPGDAAATVRNIQEHAGLYLAGVFAYLVVFVFDVVVAWALYYLLAPVHRALSLLTAWIRLIYTAAALVSMLKFATVYRLVQSAESVDAFQVTLLLDGFRHEWGLSLILFGLHLILLGALVYRSGYIPKWPGVLLILAGVSWIVYESAPLLVPGSDLAFLLVPISGEIVFMLWLLIRGRTIRPQGL